MLRNKKGFIKLESFFGVFEDKILENFIEILEFSLIIYIIYLTKEFILCIINLINHIIIAKQ